MTDPISPGWRLKLAHFFDQVGERGRKLKVRDCPEGHRQQRRRQRHAQQLQKKVGPYASRKQKALAEIIPVLNEESPVVRVIVNFRH